MFCVDNAKDLFRIAANTYLKGLYKMGLWNDENLLDMVELYAIECAAISSEDQLSEKFDDEIMPLLLEQYSQKGQEFSDQDLVNQAFNDWTDSLCKEGEIHPEQYNSYCYVGEWCID